MNDENKVFGTRIRVIRESQNLSREKAAEKANISSQFLADIENGRKGMTVVTLKKICNAFSVNADSIVFGNTETDIYSEGIFKAVLSLPESKRKALFDIVNKIIEL